MEVRLQRSLRPEGQDSNPHAHRKVDAAVSLLLLLLLLLLLYIHLAAYLFVCLCPWTVRPTHALNRFDLVYEGHYCW